MRNANSTMLTALSTNAISPVFMADITFSSGVVHVWSGVGSFSWNGNTYVGVGSFGKVGDIEESIEVNAIGTTLTLSGIDSSLLSDCQNDIQLGAPVTLWMALIQNGVIVGEPYSLFVGTVDQPTVLAQADTISISLALENKLYNLQRANCRRYTSADQRLYYPTDTAFGWVETLNDQALIWG